MLSVAATRGLAPARATLAWLLRIPVITLPIVGVTRPSHLADAIAAVDVALDEEEAAYLEEPQMPHPVVGFR